MKKIQYIIVLLLFNPLFIFSQNAFYTLGESYAKEGNYEEAIRLTRQSVELDRNSPSYLGLDYGALCEYYNSINEADSCLVYANKTLQIGKGLNEDEYQNLLIWVSHNLLHSGFTKQAIDCRNERVDYILRQYGADSPRLIKEYRILSSFYEQIGDKIKAIEYAKKEEKIAYETRNTIDNFPGRISYEESFLNLRTVIQVCEEPFAGIYYLLKILNEHRDAINDDDMMHTLNSIWVISRDNDFIEGCLAVYKERALHGNYREQLTNLINIDVEDPNISKDIHAPEYAQGLYNLVMNDELSLWFSNDDIENLLYFLPDYYSKIGLVHKSYEMAKKNYEWRKKNNLDLNFSDLRVLISGSQFKEEAQYVISLGKEILNSRRFDEDYSLLNNIHENIAKAYLKIGDSVNADKHLSQISYGDEYETLRSNASICLEMGDMESLFPLALKLTEYKNVPELNRELDLWTLMFSARDLRKSETLLENSNEYVETYRDHLLKNIPLMSDEEQTQYLRRSIYSNNLTNDLFIGIEGAEISWAASKEAYNYALLQKGILLTSQNEFRNTLKSSPDSLIRKKWNILQKQDGNYTLEYEIIKRELIKYASQQSNYLEKLSYTWQDVRDALKDDEAAIEFILCYNFKDSKYDFIDPTYIALILKKDFNEPQAVVLTTKMMLDVLGNEEGLGIDNNILYTLLWFPLETHLKDIKTIYFSPTDDLNSLPIEYVSTLGGGRMNDTYNIMRVSSTREIIRNNKLAKKEKAVLFGGLDYNMTKDSLVAQSRSGNYHYGSKQRSLPIESLRYGVEYLPGSLEEVEAVAKLFPTSPILYTEQSGIEETFKNLEGTSPDIIHLSTHGFFWSHEDVKKRDYVSFLANTDIHSLTPEENALLRSGLVFSGANIGLMNDDPLPDDVEDGILTAKELSTMNLGNVDMVVMSACESGLGENTGEGVFGLQRGFKLAGANTLLMSLWKVDDKATSEMMIEFYKHYLSGKSKQESLRLAQLKLRNSVDYSNPEYWAAFILLDALN